MDIQSDNFFPGRLYQDSFMHGKPRDRPREYPKLENEQRLNLPPLPHSRFNKIPDRTHYRNDMQFGDGSTWDTFPIMKLTKMGWVCDYDGVAMYGDCGNHASLNITDAITIETWMKSNVVDSSWHIIIDKRTTATLAWLLGIKDTNKIVFNWKNIWLDASNALTILDIGKWIYIVGVRDKTAQKAYLYLNGTLDNSVSAIEDTNSGINLYIGSRYNGGSQFFNGTIVSVCIYNRSLSTPKQKDNYWRQA